MRQSLLRYGITALSTVVLIGAYGRVHARDQASQMTTETILSRLAQALGGPERLGEVENIYTRGTLEVAGLRGKIEEWQTARGQHKQWIDLGPAYKNTIIFNGGRGWVIDRNSQITPLSGVSLEEEILTSYLGSFSYLIPGRMSGTVTTNGEDASGQSYVLQIKPEGGRAVTYFIDNKTFLPSKMETLKEGITSTTYFDDWRQVGAIKVPFRARQTENDPRNNAVIKLEDVRLNTLMEAKTFEKPESTVRDFRFEKGTNSVQIAFDPIGKTIYLSARINNSRPMWFLLDTGAGASLIDARRARTLGLKSEGEAATSGRGGSSEMSFTKGVSFTLPGVRLLNQTVVSIPFNNIAGHFRRNFGGILGYDFISRFVVQIDYVNQTITLYDPQGYNYKGSGHRVPITVDGTPFVKAEVQVNGREPVQGRFMIDTGFDGATTLYGPFIKAHNLLQSNGKTMGITRAGVAQSKGVKSRIERFTFGGFSFRNVITNFLLGEKGTEADTDIAGLIGNEVLREFKVILDYSRQEMILEPNDQFSETLDENLSGIEFELRAARRGILKVNDVAEESPADKAGIWPGDVLVAIDNQSATSFSLEEINSLFREEGREYLLTLKRGRKVFKAKIKNIRLI
jgi:hypothetical protein